MAVRREDGRVRILGRVSDVIFIKSDRFAVGPIEEKIQEIVGCLDACVFTRQNAQTQSEALIALETDEFPSDEKTRELKKMFSMLDAVHISNMSAFPKTDGGKTDRAALRKMLFEKQDALATA
jgi:acyl-coenzyme A synthetase/AMP-(fatty) acid ligase